MGQSMLTYPMIEREIIRQMASRGMIPSYNLPKGTSIKFASRGFAIDWQGKLYERAFSEEEIQVAVLKSLDDFASSYITPLLDEIWGKDPATIT